MANLLTTWEPFECSREALKESKESNGGKLVLKGILQKADTLNQNGRIYPRNILEREIRNYQKFIVENRALGECVPPGTQIFTRDGWKNIEDITDHEVIYTLNLETNEMELQRISKKVVMQFDGNLFRFKNHNSYDMCLTPNHKVIAWDRNGKPYKLTASELYEAYKTKNSYVSHSSFHSIVVYQHASLGMGLDFRFMKVEEIPYKGEVFCVTVPNGTWLMKYNGKVCWTGNCDHPDSSVVNLKNVSHIIRKAYFEGDVVKGEVEILPTPSGKILESLVESGVKLGISSRGVGSTRREGDYVVVQDDFQLICWDFVSEPSTPGAFMLAEGVRINESDLHKVFNKSDRIHRIINDILMIK